MNGSEFIWVCSIDSENEHFLEVFNHIPTIEDFLAKFCEGKVGPYKLKLPESFEANYFRPWVLALTRMVERSPMAKDLKPYCAFKPDDRLFTMTGFPKEFI